MRRNGRNGCTSPMPVAPVLVPRMFMSLLIVPLLIAALMSLAPAGDALAQPASSAIPLTPRQTELLQTQRFRHLAEELRCLVCQNQTLLDSNAPLAQDLRNEVVRLMDSGRDDDAIRTYLVDRYGEFVLYKPAISGRNAVLWFGPAALLLLAAFVWWRLGRRRVAEGHTAPARHVPSSPASMDPAPVSPGSPGTASPDADPASGNGNDGQFAQDSRLAQIDALLNEGRVPPARRGSS